MTSIDTWSPWIAITVVGGPILVGVVNIAYCFYLSRHHLDAMMEALKNSHHILIWGASMAAQGLVWRVCAGLYNCRYGGVAESVHPLWPSGL